MGLGNSIIDLGIPTIDLEKTKNAPAAAAGDVCGRRAGAVVWRSIAADGQ